MGRVMRLGAGKAIALIAIVSLAGCTGLAGANDIAPQKSQLDEAGKAGGGAAAIEQIDGLVADSLPTVNGTSSRSELPVFDIVEVGPEFVRFNSSRAGSYVGATGGSGQIAGEIALGLNTVGWLRPETNYVLDLYCSEANSSVCGHLNFTTKTNQHRWHEGPVSPIQPGGGIGPDSPIAVSAVLVEPTNESVYVVTAGHWFDEGYGNRTGGDGDGNKIGEIVYWKDDTEFDMAIIRIDDEYRHWVNPSARHWTGPAGVANPNDLNPATKLCIMSRAFDYVPENNNDLVNPRCGFLDSVQETVVRGQITPTKMGDSGGIVMDYSTGLALGWAVSLSHNGQFIMPLCIGLELATAAGLELRIATADYNPPPAPPELPRRPTSGFNQENSCQEWVIEANS